MKMAFTMEPNERNSHVIWKNKTKRNMHKNTTVPTHENLKKVNPFLPLSAFVLIILLFSSIKIS